MNQAGINLVKQFEGCQLHCYHLGDGKCTIGYGHTRPVAQCPRAGSWVITQAQADEWLLQDLQIYEQAVKNYFARTFSDNQLAALTSFCYNLGTGVFANYGWGKKESDSEITTRMIQYINPPQFREGLLRRRRAEIALYNTPCANTPPVKAADTHKSYSTACKNLEEMAGDTMNGLTGQGDVRKAYLGDFYNGVQAIINQRTGVLSANGAVRILAQETLAGRYGNGEVRRWRLGNYYRPVQDLINGGRI